MYMYAGADRGEGGMGLAIYPSFNNYLFIIIGLGAMAIGPIILVSHPIFFSIVKPPIHATIHYGILNLWIST